MSGKAPLFEPGLDELIEKGLRSGKLAFSSECRRIRARDALMF